MAEAAEPRAGQDVGLPAGVRQRQTWRPPGLRMMEALVARMTGRTEPLLERVARLSAWHGQLARGAQPTPVWSRLALEPPAGDTADAPRTPAPSAATLGAQQWALSSPPTAPAGRSQSPAGRSQSPEGAAPAYKAISGTVQRAPERVGSKVTQRPVFQLVPRSPSVWLATLRALPRTTEPPAFPPRGDALVVLGGAGSSPGPRLVLSTATDPRREVRGGFPVGPPERPATGGQRMPVGAASTLSPWDDSIESVMTKAVMNVGPAPFGSTSPPSILGPPSDAIERLIERTMVPVPLPGLKLRLVAPEELTVAGERRVPAEDSRPPAVDGTGPTPARSEQPPELDINAVADRVYQTLERRQQLERERRGLYGCR